MTGSAELLRLLPAVYRRAGAAHHPLEPLLQAIAEQLSLLERDIEQLYQNQFIETCEPWAIPYLGDLVCETAIAVGTPARNAIARREVANAVRLKGAKGTLRTLEQLATGILELPVRAVELHERLSYTQHLGQLRPRHGRTFRAGGGGRAEPFDDNSRLLGVGAGARAAPRSVALFVFPHSVRFVEKAAVRQVANGAGRYRFAGIDTQLFQRPNEPRRDVPLPLLRRAGSPVRYGADGDLAVWLSGEAEPVPASSLRYRDLSSWQDLPSGDEIIVDPELGRIASSASVAFVSYHHALPIGTTPNVDATTEQAVLLPSDALPVQRVDDVLQLRDISIAPSATPSLVVDARTRRLVVRSCIVGPILVAAGRSEPLEIVVTDSVWDAGQDARDVLICAAPGAGAAVTVELERCTVLGNLGAPGALKLRDSVVSGAVSASPLRQLHSQVAGAGSAPLFAGRSFGTPGYARLSRRSAGAILNGAHDGGELGAGHGRMFHERLARLNERIEQFVPAGWSVEVRVCDTVNSIREHA
jgi:hypothetical protein